MKNLVSQKDVRYIGVVHNEFFIFLSSYRERRGDYGDGGE